MQTNEIYLVELREQVFGCVQRECERGLENVV